MTAGWWMPALAAVLFLGGAALMARGLIRLSLPLIPAGVVIAFSASVPMALWCVAHHWQ